MKARLYSIINRIPTRNSFKTKFLCCSLAIGTSIYLYNNFKNDTLINRFIQPKIVFADQSHYIYNERVPYLVIGSGPSGYSAAINIIHNDANAKVLVVTSEKYLPYMRPILTKDLWLNEYTDYEKFEESSDPTIFVNDECIVDMDKLFDSEEHPSSSIAFLLNSKAIALDTDIREITLDDSRKVKFNKIVIATGCQPKFANIFNNITIDQNNKLINYYTMDDFIKLHQTVVSGNKTIVIMDNGATGVELCSNLVNSLYKKYNNNIVMIFRQENVLSEILPEYFAKMITEKFRQNGINVINNMDVISAKIHDDKILLELSDNRKIEADLVIDCSNYSTNVDFTEGNKCIGKACPKKLYINDDTFGYKTNSLLQSGGYDIYVCGAAASIFNPIQNSYNQITHFVHAIDSSEIVAGNITNNKLTAYNSQPIYWLEIFDDEKLDIVGDTDSSLPTCSVWREHAQCDELEETSPSKVNNDNNSNVIGDNQLLPYNSLNGLSQGVIFYYKNDTVVGIVTINLNHPIGLSDKIIRGQIKGEDPRELAKYFFTD